MNEKQSTHIQYLDLLRALAMLGVIVIHLSSPLMNMNWNKNADYWWIGNVIDSSVRFAVPLFLMLSGVTMLGKQYKLRDFYQKRFIRVLLPFIFWLFAYWIYRWFDLSAAKRPVGIADTLNWAWNLFLSEGVSKHFWYVYMILFIYLLIPFAGKILQKVTNVQLGIITVLWLFVLVFFREIPFNAYNWAGDYGHKFSGYLLHSGYLILGYFLTRLQIPWEKLRLTAGIVFLLSVLVCSFGTFQLSGKSMNLNLFSYISMNTVVQTIAVFVLLKDVTIKNKWLLKLQNVLSDYSYGIYLVHIMIIGILFNAGIYWSFAYPLISIPLLTILVALLSGMIVYILREIPGGKYISG